MADRIVVMYAGEVMEEGDVGSIFDHPVHPYTKGLLMSIPRLDQDDRRLYSIQGTVPNLDSMPEGCRFKPRCAEVCGDCKTGEPPMARVGEEHWVRCWKWTETDGGNSK